MLIPKKSLKLCVENIENYIKKISFPNTSFINYDVIFFFIDLVYKKYGHKYFIYIDRL